MRGGRPRAPLPSQLAASPRDGPRGSGRALEIAACSLSSFYNEDTARGTAETEFSDGRQRKTPSAESRKPCGATIHPSAKGLFTVGRGTRGSDGTPRQALLRSRRRGLHYCYCTMAGWGGPPWGATPHSQTPQDDSCPSLPLPSRNRVHASGPPSRGRSGGEEGAQTQPRSEPGPRWARPRTREEQPGLQGCSARAVYARGTPQLPGFSLQPHEVRLSFSRKSSAQGGQARVPAGGDCGQTQREEGRRGQSKRPHGVASPQRGPLPRGPDASMRPH